ncbi:MAG: SLBB domain-containing protein [Phycisphaerae bacterium]
MAEPNNRNILKRKTLWIVSARIGGIAWVALSGLACHSAWFNGLLDPSQVGRFDSQPLRREIRRTLSVFVDEESGMPGATEPTSEDLVVNYAEPTIEPSDQIGIAVYELLQAGQDFQQVRTVNELGYFKIPEVGRIKAAGRTPSQLELELSDLFKEQDILKDPQVSVTIIQSQSQRYTILGVVSRPGSYALPRPDFRLMDAIGDVGGLPSATKTLYVMRSVHSSAPGQPDIAQDRRMLTAPAEAPTTRSQPTPDPATRGVPAMEAPLPATAPVIESGGTLAYMFQSALATQTTQSRPSSAPTDTAPAPATSSSPSILELDDLLIQSVVPPPPVTTQAETDELDDFLEPNAPSAPWIYDPVRHDWRALESIASTSPQGEGGAEAAEPTSDAVPPSDVDWTSLAVPETVTRVIEIPTKPLLDGEQRYNIVIRPKDLIKATAGPIGEFYVMGNVLRPGAYSLNGRDLSIREAIAAAGGFGPLALPSNAELIRRGNGDEEEIIPINLDMIFAGEEDAFFLKPNDIINVGTNPLMPFIATIRSAFRISYGFGFVYDRNFADIDSFSGQSNPKERERNNRLLRGFPP